MMQNLTQCQASYYIQSGPNRKPLNSGSVKAHRLEIVSIEWTQSWRAVPHWSNWTEREVRHFCQAGWLVFSKDGKTVELDDSDVEYIKGL